MAERSVALAAPAERISLSLVMAVLNEEANLERAIARCVQAFDSLAAEFEIVIVDDGSTDRTSEIAARLAAADSRIRVLRNATPRNYGVALQQGIAAARCEWILHNPADLPLAPEDLGLFVPHFADADVIIARRIDRAAHAPWRKITSWTNQRLLRLLFQPRAVDLNFVQLYRRSYAQRVQLRTTSPAFVTPELILRAEHTGRVVREVTVEFRRREAGRAHFGKPHDILWTLRDMLWFRLYTWVRGWGDR